MRGLQPRGARPCCGGFDACGINLDLGRESGMIPHFAPRFGPDRISKILSQISIQTHARTEPGTRSHKRRTERTQASHTRRHTQGQGHICSTARPPPYVCCMCTYVDRLDGVNGVRSDTSHRTLTQTHTLSHPRVLAKAQPGDPRLRELHGELHRQLRPRLGRPSPPRL